MEGLRNDRAKEVEDDAETERVIGLVMTAIEDDLRGVAKAIISKRDDELLGPGKKTPGDSGAPMSARTPRACVNKGRVARVDGNMAYVAMVYNARSEHDSTRPPPRQVRYLSVFYDFQTLGRQLHREALDVGWTTAEQPIAISDGGVGLEDFFHTYFPKAECILDFWHAKEYLVELGKAIYPGDETSRQNWTDEACHQLKHEGGPAVRARLETLDTRHRRKHWRPAVARFSRVSGWI